MAATGNAGNIYAGKVRIRACGILEIKNRILLLQIHSPVTDELLWIPPGGGVEMGESLEETVRREFTEETGITVSVHSLLHINEMIEPPFHAIELFYRVRRVSGEPALGYDPEHANDNQLIRDIAFFTKEELQQIKVSPGYLKSAYWKEQRA